MIHPCWCGQLVPKRCRLVACRIDWDGITHTRKCTAVYVPVSVVLPMIGKPVLFGKNQKETNNGDRSIYVRLTVTVGVDGFYSPTADM